jgi:hypothetical protein
MTGLSPAGQAATAPPSSVMNSRRLMGAYPQGQILWTSTIAGLGIGSAVAHRRVLLNLQAELLD